MDARKKARTPKTLRPQDLKPSRKALRVRSDVRAGLTVKQKVTEN
jgi:hypothetical protein